MLEVKRKFVISRQLLKSGTSIGANIREAQNAESKSDFIHKIKISLKEVEETEYWLELCQHAKSYPDYMILLEKLLGIRKVLSKNYIHFKIKLHSLIHYSITKLFNYNNGNISSTQLLFQ